MQIGLPPSLPPSLSKIGNCGQRPPFDMFISHTGSCCLHSTANCEI